MKAEVFILFGCTEQSDFVDSHGEAAGDREDVIGVYHSEKDAVTKRTELEADNSYDYYRIESHAIV